MQVNSKYPVAFVIIDADVHFFFRHLKIQVLFFHIIILVGKLLPRLADFYYHDWRVFITTIGGYG